MRAWLALPIIALALAPGCSCSQRGSLAGDGDGGSADARPGDAAPDGARADGPRRDGGGDAGACAEPWAWRLEPRVVASAELVMGTPPRMGVADRIAIHVWLDSSCEVLGRVELVPLDVGACCVDFWVVRAWAWTADGCEPGDGPKATWIVTIGGRTHANEQVALAASEVSSALLLEYTREGYTGPDPPYRLCQLDTPPGTQPEGAACATDCQCAAGLACVGYYAGVTGAPTWTCQRPCNDVLDCGADGTCRDFVEGPARVCDRGDQCTWDADCPSGFRCAAGSDHLFCLDERPFVVGQECACDATCPTGQRCAAGGPSSCEIPCLRDADCPSGPSEIAFECGAAGVCVPLGYD